MSKWRDYIPVLKLAVTIANPIAGAVVSIIDNVYTKPKEKVQIMLEGKKTYVGIAIAIIPVIGRLFGYEATAEFQDGATIIINDLVSLVGMIIATYGRAKTNGTSLFTKN